MNPGLTRPDAIDEPGPGQESVWDYPRPPSLERANRHVEVRFADETIADTTRAFVVRETSLAPSYYIPPDDVRMDLLEPARRTTVCEWKGGAQYWHLRVGGRLSRNAAWAYPEPTQAFEAIAGYVSFYPDRVDEALVDGERARGQAGGFYGGWITSDVVGPFKGGAGTAGW